MTSSIKNDSETKICQRWKTRMTNSKLLWQEIREIKFLLQLFTEHSRTMCTGRKKQIKWRGSGKMRFHTFLQFLHVKVCPFVTHQEVMIAYLTQYFPTVHGCNCGSGVSMFIELHKAVRVVTCCLEWTGNAHIKWLEQHQKAITFEAEIPLNTRKTPHSWKSTKRWRL